MDRNGRFETIEDALSLYHDEQWFTWTDHNNKIYENIVVTNPDRIHLKQNRIHLKKCRIHLKQCRTPQKQ